MYRYAIRLKMAICANWSIRNAHKFLRVYVLIASINKCVPHIIKAKI